MAIIGLTVFFTQALLPLQYDFSFTALFLGDGDQYDDLRSYVDRFGSDVNQVAAILETDDVFSALVLSEIQRVSAELQDVPGRERILSITEVERLVAEGLSLDTVPLVPTIIPTENEALETIRADVMAQPQVGGLIVSVDSEVTALVVKLGSEHGDSSCSDGIDNDGSGLIDCADPACFRSQYVSVCGQIGPEEGNAACSDSIDNDENGQLDCQQESCLSTPVCSLLALPATDRETDCFNGQDDDGNGAIDCLDHACVILEGESCDAVAAVTQITQRSQARLEEMGHPSVYHLAGVPYVHNQYIEVSQHDRRTLLPIVFLIVAFMLGFLFRAVWGVAIPMAVVGLAMVWTVGLMMATGQYLDMINTVIPTLLLVIGIADSVHLLSRFRDEVGTDGNVKNAVRRTLRWMVPACTMTSLTAAVGFVSLTTATLPIIRNFGGYAGIGIGIAYVLTITIVPLVLYHLPIRRTTKISEAAKSSWLVVWLRLLSDSVISHRRRYAVACVVVLAVWSSGLFLVHQDSQMMAELREGSPAQVSNELIESRLFGVLSNAIVIEANERNAAANPQLLEIMDEIGRWAEAYVDPDNGSRPVSHALSIVDLVEEGWGAYNQDDDGSRWPDSTIGVVSLLDLVPADISTRWLSLDRRITHVTLLSRDSGTSVWNPLRLRLIEQMDRLLAEHGLSDDYSFHLTGSSTLAQGALGFIVRDLLTSLGLAFVVILCFMTIIFRSFKVGLLSMVPNVLPLFCTLCLIGIMGIPLRISTVIIFSVSLGIAIDDTIHFLARLREEQMTCTSYEQALRKTMVGTGRAILITTLILVAGFGSLFFSDFVAIHEMGLLGSFTLTMALVADLIVLPLLLLKFKPILTKRSPLAPNKQKKESKPWPRGVSPDQ